MQSCPPIQLWSVVACKWAFNTRLSGPLLHDTCPARALLQVLVANSEQLLHSAYGRRMITMQKVSQYDAAAAVKHFERMGPPIMAADELREFIQLENGRVRSGNTSNPLSFRSKVI
jgi:hypothetical protein